MSWLEVAKAACEKAEEKVKESEVLLGLANEAYRRKPTRENGLALKAAIRLVKEARSQREEWEL